MEPVLDRRSPVDLPGPEGDNTIAREPLWYAFGAGDDQPQAPPWTYAAEPPPDTHVMPPPPALDRDAPVPLPRGTSDLLDRVPYPHGRAAATPADPAEALERALVTCFSPLRREPENPYNDHRCYPSARCLFPVQAFVGRRDGWHMLDPDRHTLVRVAGPAARTGVGGGETVGTVVLAGRYTRIPRTYKWFRGSLVTLELGTVLRALCIALELFGLQARLRLPGADSREVLAGLGLAPEWEWSLPLLLDVRPSGARTDAEPVAAPAGGPGEEGTPPASDEALVDLLRVNRGQDFSPSPEPVGPAVPEDAAASAVAPSWAELLWRRNSGRMPRGLHGMSGLRRDGVPAEVVRDAARWLAVPPPGTTLAAVHECVGVSAVVQGVDRFADGVYGLRDGEAVLRREDGTAAALLERHYGYGATPGNGCDLRHATMTCFLSVRPRDLFERFGPSGWSAMQYACGWMTQGVCLSAAASGLFARPVRAFQEVPTQEVLGLDPAEMLVIAVVVQAQRHHAGLQLDLRV